MLKNLESKSRVPEMCLVKRAKTAHQTVVISLNQLVDFVFCTHTVVRSLVIEDGEIVRWWFARRRRFSSTTAVVFAICHCQ